MPAVQVKHISKTYNKGLFTAVNKVSFEVNEGEVFGLIGPDGAGKTSLFRMLTTLLLPDSGSALVDGFDIVKDYKAIRNRVGYMPGKFSLYQDLTVEENLRFFATIFNTSIRENYALIEKIYVQIEPFKHRRAGQLSGGMKQKLALCCALIHKPRVLFLDEPTTGVDAVSRREFWEMLADLKKQGITILVSTPYMDEASLCDRIALMQKGEIMSIDTPKQIIKNYPYDLLGVKASNMGKLLLDLRSFENMHSCFAFGEYIHVAIQGEESAVTEQLHNYLKPLGHSSIEINRVIANIEDCFIELMSESTEKKA